uniref:F5/8 type C domain-containing protein n=1 Tax=Chlamydomonas euryale TaxID=1486919 RepID=A0A7R9VJX8_9CHLO|mmetsp:Transcript_37096/g.109401  ORF Transcript_37096/g.109401 Transcript_37096/m.109401 type:complete len:162 (+) Transcript_37096:190-675(+)
MAWHGCLQCSLPAALYPIGGGHITGSGGDASMEDAPPANAFDGNDQTRWVDINGGGIGNTSWLGYEHTEAVKVMEYTITTQMYALSSYHSHLSGAPRDWELRARTAGGWVLVDKRALVYFAGHREERRFVAQSPVVATEYRFEFSAVAAGCASQSIQVSIL